MIQEVVVEGCSSDSTPVVSGCHKDQSWDNCYFCYSSLTCQARSPQTQASSPMIRNTSSVSYMIYYLQWEALESRRTKIQLTLFFKVIHNLIDISADRLYLIPSTTRTRSIQSKKYRHFFPSSDSFKFSFFPRTVPLWNSLPAVLAEAHFCISQGGVILPLILSKLDRGPVAD